MSSMVPYIQAASGVHLLIAAANVLLPRKLQYRENLSRVSPMVRQIFIVHSVYIVLVVVFFGVLCLMFAPELAGGSALGRCLSAFLALFWLSRAGIQLFYYDQETRKQHPVADLAMLLAVLAIGVVFSLEVVL